MSAAISHPGPAKSGTAIPFKVVVYADHLGTVHYPEGKELTRCRRVALSRLEATTLEPNDRVCKGCNAGEVRGR